MKGFHSVTSKVANILSPLSGFGPSGQKLEKNAVQLLTSMCLSAWDTADMPAEYQNGQDITYWSEWLQMRNQCDEVHCLRHRTFAYNCLPRDWIYQKPTPLQDQSQWLRNGSPLTRSVQESTGGADIKPKLDFPWGCYIFSHIRIIPEDVFFPSWNHLNLFHKLTRSRAHVRVGVSSGEMGEQK